MRDVVIVGGGMVGAALAVGLAQKGLTVTVFEQRLPQPYSAEQLPDMRVSAINHASQKLLEDLGAWPLIDASRLCQFKRMAVWENDQSRTEFHCDDVAMPYLGYIVENRLIQLALLARFDDFENLKLLEGERIKAITQDNQTQINILHVDKSADVHCKLLIAADGGQSRTRQMLNIGTQGWQYAQNAMGINVRMGEGKQRDITWQKFRPTGPLAYLPLYGDFASLVWYDDAQTVKKLAGLNSQKLHAEIQQHFPAQLGEFEVLNKASFPLTRMHANQYVKKHAALVGDAAHTINPLAGQGVNIGFKDVAAMLAVLQDWQGNSESLAAKLVEYEKKRRAQNLLMMTAMDGFYTVFSNDFAPLKMLRNMGLSVADKAGPIKKQVIKYAMGID